MAEHPRGEDRGKIVNYTFPTDLHERMKRAAERKGQTLKVWLLRAAEKVAAEEEEAAAEEERRRRR